MGNRDDSPHVEFSGVEKSFDGVSLVVRNLNLSIGRGEFLTLLGPSGSGKTTTLMMLAGFETPTRGEITLDGQPDQQRAAAQARHRHGVPELRAVPAHDGRRERRLSAQGAARGRGRDRGRGSSARSTWSSCQHRRTAGRAQLSGGQQQRVALARALVFEPKLVLMDEPLGALDKQLREHMQIEIKHIHDRLGVTVVYVTHDQAEALTMSDRIAVFNDGVIQQLAPPTRLYERARQRVRRAASSARTIACTAESRGRRGRALPVSSSTAGERGAAVAGNVGGGGSATTLSLRPERRANRSASRDAVANRCPRRMQELDLSWRPCPRPHGGCRQRGLHRQGAERSGCARPRAGRRR